MCNCKSAYSAYSAFSAFSAFSAENAENAENAEYAEYVEVRYILITEVESLSTCGKIFPHFLIDNKSWTDRRIN